MNICKSCTSPTACSFMNSCLFNDEHEQLSAATFVPSDPALAKALDTAQRLASDADKAFCEKLGGDGETVAYWLTQSIMDIRSALFKLQAGEPRR